MSTNVKYKGATMYVGIRHRNDDGTYKDLDALSNLSICIFNKDSKIIGKKTGASTGEYTITRNSATQYYIVVPHTASSDMAVGSYNVEISELDTTAGTWKSIGKLENAFVLKDSESKSIEL